MAKVRGPLMSFTASGSIARKAVTFSRVGTKTVAKHFGFDKRLTSPAQAIYYQSVKNAHTVWRNLPQYMKDQWATTAQNQPGSGDNTPWRPQVKGKLLF